MRVHLVAVRRPWMDVRKMLVVGLLIGYLASAASAELPNRPVSGQGPEARTLLVYADERSAYSLADGLERLSLQLRRVDTRLESVPTKEATSNKIAQADYLVVFCPQGDPRLGTNLLQAIATAKQPVLWVGFGADQLQTAVPFKDQFQVSGFSAPNPALHVNYAGRNWEAPVVPWISCELPPRSESKVLMSFPGTNTSAPLCWKFRNWTFYAGVPGSGLSGCLFEDLLLDFYEAKEVAPPRLLLRIEDYQARSDHRQFERMADFLHSRHIPFVIALLPALAELDSQPEFLGALRYAQQRGGRVILKGVDADAQRSALWDPENDRALSEASKRRAQLGVAARKLIGHGLLPLGFETPGYATSREVYTEVAKVFSTAFEQVQLSDATASERGVAGGLTVDRYGRLIVPDNMGCVLDSASNAFAGILTMGQAITRLRGTVGSCCIFAYQPLSKLSKLVDTLDALHVSYLDIADLDNVVETPDLVLLSGRAQRTIANRNGKLHWKAFDRAGKLLAEKREEAGGVSIFKRRGEGDYEVFEFEEKP
jgi:uncharacterized protein YdaL